MKRNKKQFSLKAIYKGHPWKGKEIVIPMDGWKHGIRIGIFPRFDDDLDKIIRFTVNWSALGCVTSDVAMLYGKAISRAAREAGSLTLKYKGFSTMEHHLSQLPTAATP